jgi:hypothetical protein
VRALLIVVRHIVRHVVRLRISDSAEESERDGRGVDRRYQRDLLYYRGMNGDLNADGTTKTVTITESDGYAECTGGISWGHQLSHLNARATATAAAPLQLLGL